MRGPVETRLRASPQNDRDGRCGVSVVPCGAAMIGTVAVAVPLTVSTAPDLGRSFALVRSTAIATGC